MVFYANVAYEEVLRLVIEGLRPLLGDEGLMQSTVSKGAISQARGRVGSGPLKALYQEQVQPHGLQGMPGVFYRGLRIMAIDGSTLDMPDEAANAECYGYPPASRGASAFPKLRFVAMAECGTHTLCYAEPGPYERGERELALSVMAHADSSMLVTADRGFYSYAFWKHSLDTGARLLFRPSSVVQLPREEVLPDGGLISARFIPVLQTGKTAPWDSRAGDRIYLEGHPRCRIFLPAHHLLAGPRSSARPGVGRP